MGVRSKWRDEPLRVRLARPTPSCIDCGKYLPHTDGWACCSPLNLDKKPDPVVDLSSGHCDEFTYRTTQVPAGFWKEHDEV